MEFLRRIRVAFPELLFPSPLAGEVGWGVLPQFR